uniref:tripartite tricarboxylate transporter TctB family protein n=1 Tax=Halomonas sp. TaxID=1486246 RepID=UPI0026154A25|nr:tripartite tricarboxylate transporter TctB family protein [Halomonas sp.]
MKILSWLGSSTGVAVLLLALTLVYLVAALGIAPPISNGNITASFFPVVLGLIMLVALGTSVLGGRRKTAAESEDEPSTEADASTSFGPLAVVVLTAAYIALFSLLGYFISTALYAFAMTLVFSAGRPGRQQLLVKALIAVAIAVLGYGLFEWVFQVRLPVLWG